MTLNITVVTEKRIFQCADYRLTDVVTGRPYDDDAASQKVFIVGGHMWLATLCFNGVGRTGAIEVSRWVGQICKQVTMEDSFDSFLDRLVTADQWLSRVPPRSRRHTFTVGAFLARRPVLALVSNYETLDRNPSASAMDRLSIHRAEPSRSVTFVSGQPDEVARPRRRALASLASRSTNPGGVFNALARVNQDVARQNDLVSLSCFTTSISRTGEGHGQPHGIVIPETLEHALPSFVGRAAMHRMFPGPRALKQFAVAYVWMEEEEFHAIQLIDKGNSADTHSNYGHYLQNIKKDLEGAVSAYERALEINATHATALSNLAGARVLQGNANEAQRLYRAALASAPGHENASFNYARWLLRNGHSVDARQIAENGANTNPKSGRIYVLLGEIALEQRRPGDALEMFHRARELNADQEQVEVGHAFALHISGAPVDDCIGAYRTAIALNDESGDLKLNMAQLLLAVGRRDEGLAMLLRAQQQGLSDAAQLEALFYRLAYSDAEAGHTFAGIRALLNRGARLNWDVGITVASLAQRDTPRAGLLKEVADVLAGTEGLARLDRLQGELME